MTLGDEAAPSGTAPDDFDGGDGLHLGVAVGCVAGAGGLLTLAAFLLFGAFAASSVAIGAAMMALDLYLLGRVVRALLGGNEATETGVASNGKGPASRALWMLVGLAKLLVLFGGAWKLVSAGLVLSLGLAMGIGALPLGLTLYALSAGSGAARRSGTRLPRTAGRANRSET